MTDAPKPDTLSLALERQIDAVCQRFEAAWKATGTSDRAPRIEDYLPGPSEAVYPALLLELIRLDLFYRRRRGDTARTEDYAARFPTLDPDALAAATADAAPSPEADGRIGPIDHGTPPNEETMDDAGPVRPGRRFAGYEVLGESGRGGMGAVYKAWQPGVNRLVALKVVLAGAHAGAQDLARFRTEAEAFGRLQHPNIVQVFETNRHDDLSYLVLEYVDGGSLAQRLGGTPLPPRPAAELMETVAGAVHFAHDRGILHRDLKPANVLLTADGTPKVADFGLAKRVEAGSGLTQTGAILGTPSYMAPEQANDSKAVGPLADVYALGAILYECLTGRPPFKAATALDTVLQVIEQEPVAVRRLNPPVPTDLETICHKCLQKDPAKRYASAAALADDLRRWLDGRPIAARPVGKLERAVRWARRNPQVAALLGTVFALLTAAAVGATVAAVRIDDARRKADASASAAGEALTKEAEANKAARAAEAEARYRLTRLHDVTGALALDHGAPSTALLWHVRAWEGDRDPATEPDHRVRVGVAAANLPRLAGICFHPTDVADAAIDASGTRVLTCPAGSRSSRERWVFVWDHAAGRLSIPPLTHDQPIRRATFNPAGDRVATASDDQTAALWDVTTGKRLFSLPHPGRVMGVAFSPDGKMLATAGDGKTLRLWDATTGQPIGPTFNPPADLVFVGFSSDGRRMVTADRENHVRVWNTQTGEQDGPAVEHVRPNATQDKMWKTDPVLSPDGTRLLTNTATAVTLWEMPAGTKIQLTNDRGRSFQFSRDGKMAIVVTTSNTGYLRDIFTGREVASFAHAREVHYAALSPDGQLVATASTNGGVHLWDVKSRRKLFMVRCADYVRQLRFSEDGRLLLAASMDGTARVWDVSQPVHLPITDYAFDCGRADAAGWYSRAIYSPDGQVQLRVGAEGARLCRTAADPGQLLPDTRRLIAARFSPDGRRVVTFARDIVQVWNAATGKPVGPPHQIVGESLPLARQPGGVTDYDWPLKFDAEGRRVTTSFAGHTLQRSGELVTQPGSTYVWEVETGREMFRLPKAVSVTALSPDGRFLAVGAGGELSVYEVDGGHRLFRTRANQGLYYLVEFSPDSRSVLLVSSDTLVRVWDARTGQPLSPPLRHPIFPVCGSFSPDGKRVVTTDRDGVLRVWDVRTGDILLAAETGANSRCWFSRDGLAVQFAAGGTLKRIRLPVFPGSADDAQRLTRLLTAQFLDETDGAVPIPHNEFIHNRLAYRMAWLIWNGLPDAPAAQPSGFAPAVPAQPGRLRPPSPPRVEVPTGGLSPKPMPGALAPAEAAKRVDEVCSVGFRVENIGRSRTSNWVFLNSHEDFRHPENFTIAVRDGTDNRLRKFGLPVPVEQLQGRTIQVRGKVTLHQDRPQIIVEQAGQVQIIDP
jgi:WD40 repeat protein